MYIQPSSFSISRIALCALLASLLPCLSGFAANRTSSGSIGDTVFCDFNRDGVQQTGEPGLAGVKVTLTGVHVTATATTDANGNYLFDGLRAGKYTVSVDPSTAPPGCDVILPNCPLSITVSVSPGQAVLTVDFCFGTNGTIGDTVFCDLNRDGMQETGEPGLEGVKVTLTGSNITETAFTDANGHYLFTGLAPDTYTVTVDPTTAPPDCNVILPNCPLTDTVPLALGQVYLQADFCFGQTCVVGVIGSIDLGKASNGAVIGLVNTKITNSNVIITGNEYVSQGGSISNMAPSTVTGDVYQYSAGQYSGPGKLDGSVFTDPALLAEVDADALNAAAAAKQLAATQTFGTISTATTVTGNGGQNVIQIDGDIKKSLTLSGTANDTFIVNVTGTVTLGGSDALGLSGGVTANNVLYNFTGASGTISTHVDNVVNGTLLAPTYGFDLDGTFNGAIIGGGKTITLKSGADVFQPTCP